MAIKHDLIFFEKRSTPKVVSRGMSFTAPDSYGKQTRRRPATEEEEKIIARGDWLRVDQSGKKGGEEGYKKTTMAGREHLVKHEDDVTQMSFGEFLEHHGVKGMKWGVRKDYVAIGRDAAAAAKDKITEKSSAAVSTGKAKASAAKDSVVAKKDQVTTAAKDGVEGAKQIWKDPSQTVLTSKAAANLKANQAKFEAKFQPSEGPTAPKRTLTPEQKAALIKLGIGAVVVGGLAYTSYKNQAFIKSLPGLAGQKISASAFQKAVFHSKMQTWATNKFITRESEEREGFEIPAGNLFHRISMADEKDFANFTYTVPDVDDYNRYLVGFRGEKGNATLHHITYRSEKPIKVPNLETTLKTLRESMVEEFSNNPEVRKKYDSTILKDSDVRAAYQRISGGNWDKGELRIGEQKGLATLFRQKLMEKGYGAIIDEMDAGVIGNRPLVLLDHGSMGPKSASLITSANIREAENNLTELSNRKL